MEHELSIATTVFWAPACWGSRWKNDLVSSLTKTELGKHRRGRTAGDAHRELQGLNVKRPRWDLRISQDKKVGRWCHSPTDVQNILLTSAWMRYWKQQVAQKNVVAQGDVRFAPTIRSSRESARRCGQKDKSVQAKKWAVQLRLGTERSVSAMERDSEQNFSSCTSVKAGGVCEMQCMMIVGGKRELVSLNPMMRGCWKGGLFSFSVEEVKECWKMVEATSTGFQKGLQLQGKYCCRWIARSLEDPQYADARSCSSTWMRVESRGLQRAAQCFYTLTCGEQWSVWIFSMHCVTCECMRTKHAQHRTQWRATRVRRERLLVRSRLSNLVAHACPASQGRFGPSVLRPSLPLPPLRRPRGRRGGHASLLCHE